MEDHIHCLFQYHPDLELSKLINNLKSVCVNPIVHLAEAELVTPMPYFLLLHIASKYS